MPRKPTNPKGPGLEITPEDRPSLVSSSVPSPIASMFKTRPAGPPKPPRPPRRKPKSGAGGTGGGRGRGGGGGRNGWDGFGGWWRGFRRWRGWRAVPTRLILRYAALALIWILVVIGGLIGWYAIDLPDINSLAALTRKPSINLVSADGQVFASFGDVYGETVTLADLPKWLPEAVLSTEDRRFYHHFGIDLVGLSRAIFANMVAGRVVQGGSTLTQQLAKNLFLSPERSLKRKVQELLLALELEHRFSKDQILTIYLNRVYLGHGSWGVDAAARRYFGVPAKNLSLYQSALLAGLLKAPSRYNPENDSDLSRDRTHQVLENMVQTGAITEAQVRDAEKTGPDSVREVPDTGHYFADWIKSQIDQYVHADTDIVVKTTLDITLEQKAEADVETILAGPGAKADISQGAVVVMSPDGAVRAMVGGRDYDDSQFNRATQAQRQPGSSFKLFLYLAALEAGHTPDDTILDEPITEGSYRPEDFGHKYEGEISLRRALAVSSNVAAVRLILEIGPKRVAEMAKRLGIESELNLDASLALGTAETTLLQMTAAYAVLANKGDSVMPFGISEIDDKEGHVLYKRQGSGSVQVIAPHILTEMDDMLGAVIAEGTGREAALGRPAAGKTGTTQDYHDAWFLGFTADYVTGVWMGNDDNSPMKRITGGTLPTRLWRQVMVAAEQGLPEQPLPMPPQSLETISQAIPNTVGTTVDNVWTGLVHLFGGSSPQGDGDSQTPRPTRRP